MLLKKSELAVPKNQFVKSYSDADKSQLFRMQLLEVRVDGSIHLFASLIQFHGHSL